MPLHWEFIYPRSTRRNLALAMASSSSVSVSLLLWYTAGVVLHWGEHRYWSRGSRYFPQKSTNFTCSTLEVKYTPERKNCHCQTFINLVKIFQCLKNLYNTGKKIAFKYETLRKSYLYTLSWHISELNWGTFVNCLEGLPCCTWLFQSWPLCPKVPIR